MLRCSPNTFVLGLIIHPDDSFLVSTPIKVKGIESEKRAFPSMQWSLCRSDVTDDTRLYAYFIGTCIFYSIILGTPLLCSQYVGWPEDMEVFFVWLCNISGTKMWRIEMRPGSHNRFRATGKVLTWMSLFPLSSIFSSRCSVRINTDMKSD